MKDKERILIVSPYYSPEIGAAPSRIANMAEGLLREGVEVDVLTCLPNYPKGRIFSNYRGRFYKHENINGINVFRYWTYATVSKKPLARLISMLAFSFNIWVFACKLCRILRYDKVIIQTPPILVAFSAMILFGKVFRRKTVLNVSDLWPLSAVELGAVKQGGLYYKVLSAIERFIYRNATAYQGQSKEILSHIASFNYHKPHFLYRNLQPTLVTTTIETTNRRPLLLVYAGLLGVAQDILGMIKAINFKELGAELHLYGGGNQADKIAEYVSKTYCGVVCHGYVSKEEINKSLSHYHASIVPLAVRIKGAVPSKIFDLMPQGVPILFCGSGEGEDIVKQYNIGLTSPAGDAEALKENIKIMSQFSDEEYRKLRERCLNAAQSDFSFSQQMKQYFQFLKTL